MDLSRAPNWFVPFVESETTFSHIEPLVAQLDHFCDILTGAARPLVSVADAGASLRVVEAIRRAVALGSTVLVSDVC